jgi:3-polyprenyl-4-hydroxybenzoate decarboxylase
VEFNSTIVSLTTIANVSDEDVENKTNSAILDDVTSSETFIDSTVFATSAPLETTDGSSPESNTTIHESDNLTTMLTQMNETQVYTEKNEEQTTVVSNTSCESSKYGCCSDGVTQRHGKNLKKEESFFILFLLFRSK